MKQRNSYPSIYDRLEQKKRHESCNYYLLILHVCTGAGEAPWDVRAEAESPTEISVQWSGLSNCRLVNGRITQYRVQFTTNDRAETVDQVLGDGEDWMSGGRVTLTGLTSLTNYSISVAAVNENGDVGLYSDPLTVVTLQASRSHVQCPVSVAY